MSVLNNIYVFSGFFCYVTMIYKRSFPSTLNSRDAEFFFSENIYFSRTQFCKKLKVWMVFQEGTSGRYMSMSIFLIPVGKVCLVSLIGIVCVYHLSIGRKVNIIINQ